MFQRIMAGIDKLIGIATGGINVDDDADETRHDKSDEEKQI